MIPKVDGCGAESKGFCWSLVGLCMLAEECGFDYFAYAELSIVFNRKWFDKTRQLTTRILVEK